VRPQILFPAYLSGFNLIEAFYLAIPHLSWQTIVIGDPLCAPFEVKALTSSDIEDPVDPQTETPGLFSARRVEYVHGVLKTVPRAAVVQRILAESRVARGDKAGAQRALEQATEIAPTVVGPQLQLALMYEEAGDYRRAADRYRKILEAEPDHAVALNNLAYTLADQLKAPEEARSMAQRAATLAPNDPNVIDTMAWIEHLLGNHVEAAKLIAKAVKGGSGIAQIRLHAAFIYDALQDATAAREELEAALKIDPELVKRDDVKALQARIGRKDGLRPAALRSESRAADSPATGRGGQSVLTRVLRSTREGVGIAASNDGWVCWNTCAPVVSMRRV
jgi:Tfp pilus assembly protein PilF